MEKKKLKKMGKNHPLFKSSEISLTAMVRTQARAFVSKKKLTLNGK